MRDGAGIVSRIYKNLGKLLSGKAVAGILSLAYLAIAARALGPLDYGVLVLTHTFILTIGGVIEFPGWHALVRYGAQALAQDDRARLTRLIIFAGLVEGAAGLCAIGAAAILGPMLGARLGWTQTAINFSPLYSLAILSTVRSTPAGYLQLTGRFDLIAWHNVVAPLVRLIGAIIAWRLHCGLYGFLVAWLAAAIFEWAVMWLLGAYAAWGQLVRVAMNDLVSRTIEENPGIRKFMLAANADVTMKELADRVAPIAIGVVLDAAAAGLYSIAQRITAVLSQPALILGQAAYAEFAILAARGTDGSHIRATWRRIAGAGVLAAMAVCAIIGVWGPQIATLAAGPSFSGAALPMTWLAFARALYVAAPPTTAALIALGRPGLSVRANFLANVLLLAALPPMLSVWGVSGAGVHALLQSLTVVGLLAVSFWRETAAPLKAEARSL